MGLEGETPQGVDTNTIDARVKHIQTSSKINLLKENEIKFIYEKVKFMNHFFLSHFPNLIN